MGFFSSIFSVGETSNKIVDAAISTGDKLFFTSEEKAEMNMEMRKFFPTLLNAYHPFKLAQRILAVWFSLLFGLAFLAGLGMTFFNIYTKYTGLKNNIPPDKIILLDTQDLINIVVAFNIHWIITAIVAFYFTGGVINSFKKGN